MKIAIGYKIHKDSWGGGNQFVKSLVKAAKDKGYEVVYELKDKNIDIILIIDPRSYEQGIPFSLFDIFKYLLFKNKYAVVVHRINECDERKNTKNINSLLRRTNYLADHTVFISSWLKNLRIYQKDKPSSVIYNGANGFIFKNKNKFWNKKSPLKIVTHHWSCNYNKGFDVYQKLDKLLLSKKWADKIKFTYIGNIPNEFKFYRTNHLLPMHGKKLGIELSKHDLYLTASLNEPAGMHHIEGALSGLPLLYRNSGALPEYCKNYGVSFDNSNFIDSLENILVNYEEYKIKIKKYPNNATKMSEKYLNLFTSLISKRKQIVKKRELFSFPLSLIVYFIIHIYSIKNLIKYLMLKIK